MDSAIREILQICVTFKNLCMSLSHSTYATYDSPPPHVVPLHCQGDTLTENSSLLTVSLLTLKTMLKYKLQANNNKKSDYFGKIYAYPVIEETVDLDGLAGHMASHNTPFSKGVIKGLLTDMVSCIKELMLEGKNVKVNDLAIFSVGIKNAKGGADSEEDFSVAGNIQTVKFRARATGELTSKSLDLNATLKRVIYVGKKSVPADDSTGSDTTEP